MRRTPEFRYLFGKLVIKRMGELGLNVAQTAERVYGEKSGREPDVSAIKRGKIPVGPSTLQKFKDALGITDEEIEHISSERFVRPDPEVFPFRRFGNIELPLCHLFGQPSHPYEMHEFEYRHTDANIHESATYPRHLHQQLPELWERYREARDPNRSNTDNQLPRLTEFTCAGEDEADNRGNAILITARTNWFAYCATNRLLFERAKNESGKLVSVREAFSDDPLNLSSSHLGNTYSVHTVLISSSPHQNPQKQFVVLRRASDSGIYPNVYQSSAGYVSLADKDANGHYSPFNASQRETISELGESLDITPDKIRITGLCMSWEDQDLNFCAFCETAQPAEEILSMFVKEDYEGKRTAIAWTVGNVIKHIAENNWDPVGAYNVILALIYYFGREAIDHACAKCRVKHWVDFLEYQ